MLRRAQSRPVEDETDAPGRGAESPVRVERRGRDSARPDADWTEAPVVDRRNLDAWRAEVLQSVVTDDDDSPVQSGRPNGLKALFQPARIALLLVALAAGGVAAYLTMYEAEPVDQAAATDVAAEPAAAPVPVTEVIQPVTARILVAAHQIAVGEILEPGSVEWVEWPETAIRPDYITFSALPDAETELAESMARAEFFPGEPIRQEKLAEAGDGLLSAMLSEGTRGVSVSVAAESASGGFIVPNDRVDVVLTHATAAGQQSETVLTNVRVLAINTWLGGTRRDAEAEEDQEEPEVFSDVAIATLELRPEQAEVVINATSVGRLALVLRPKMEVAKAGDSASQALNQAIRISSPFWTNAGNAQ